MPNPLTTFLKQYHDIPAGDEELIIAATEYRHYKESEYLFKSEKVAREIFFVCKGVLRIMAVNESGNEVTHFFTSENRLCTILNSFNNQVVAHESIQAACNVEVLAISRVALDMLYHQLPYLQPLVTQIIQQALLDKIALRNAYLGEDSTTRYKKFISQQPDIALKVSLSDIASYLGVTPQSLSRIRKNIR
jgi:CRP-like cAMP-binding protein